MCTEPIPEVLRAIRIVHTTGLRAGAIPIRGRVSSDNVPGNNSVLLVGSATLAHSVGLCRPPGGKTKVGPRDTGSSTSTLFSSSGEATDHPINSAGHAAGAVGEPHRF